jgi:hypothetical protein
MVAKYPFSKYSWASAFRSSARLVAVRFGVCVGLGVAEGRGVCVAVGAAVSVAVDDGAGVFVGMGVGCKLAQAIETRIKIIMNDIKECIGFRCICPPKFGLKRIIFDFFRIRQGESHLYFIALR